MIAVGFDVGTHRIALSIPTLQWVAEVDCSKSHVGRRDAELRTLLKWVNTRIMAQGIDVAAFIERPFLSGSAARNPNTTIGMAETVGVIRASVVWSVPTTMVNPSSWKAELLENGRASKSDARRWLEHRIGADEVATYSEDQVDATCVALYGQGVMSGDISLPQPKKKARKPRG